MRKGEEFRSMSTGKPIFPAYARRVVPEAWRFDLKALCHYTAFDKLGDRVKLETGVHYMTRTVWCAGFSQIRWCCPR